MRPPDVPDRVPIADFRGSKNFLHFAAESSELLDQTELRHHLQDDTRDLKIQAFADLAQRLGTMFGSDHYGIKPDLITIAKGLTSAYAPLSGVIVSDKVWTVLVDGSDKLGSLGHGWTYSVHPICTAAGVANLELIDELDLVKNAGETGAYFRSELTKAVGGHKNVSDVRGDGMLAAAEFVADRDDRIFFGPSQKIGPQVAAALAERGVIGRAMPQGDILGFAPPLCLTREEADIVVAKTADAVNSVFARG